MSFLDCHWILLRHLEFKKIQGKKTDSAECRKIVIFICFTFSLSYCFLSYIFNFLKIFLHIFSYRKIDSRWNEYYLLKICRPIFFLYQTTHNVTCNYLAWFRHEIQAMYGQVSVLQYLYIYLGLCLLLFYSVT